MERECCITKVHGFKYGHWICSAIFKTKVRTDKETQIHYAKINHKTIHIEGGPRPVVGTLITADILEDWELKYA